MILVDASEPKEIINLLRQTAPVNVLELNRLHMSDYFFTSVTGKRYQYSRKQASELLGIRLLDHVIVGETCYSFADSGAL